MGSDERARLKLLLKHWVEHNREHGEEFREWADKARAFGESSVADEMLQAAAAMDEASEFLSQSLRRLEK